MQERSILAMKEQGHMSVTCHARLALRAEPVDPQYNSDWIRGHGHWGGPCMRVWGGNSPGEGP